MSTPIVTGQANDPSYDVSADQWNAVVKHPAITATYTILKEGSTYYAMPLFSGGTKYSGADAATVIQAVENYLESAGGGRAFFKKATYDTSSAKLLIDSPNIEWLFEPGAKIESDELPFLHIDGSGYGFDAATALNNIIIRNMRAQHTGSVAAGDFIFIDTVQAEVGFGENPAGGLIFDNINLYGAGRTNENYHALHLEDVVGFNARNLHIHSFGTGVEHTTDAEQGSDNIYDFLTGDNVVSLIHHNANETRLELRHPKVIDANGWGMKFTSASLAHVLLICPQIEGTSDGIWFNNTDITVINPMISLTATNTGIWHSNANGVLFIVNPYFNNVNIAIQGNNNKILQIGGSYAGTVNYKFWPAGATITTFFNSSYLTENRGTSTGTGAQQTIAHGLGTTPTHVLLSDIASGANPYQSAAADATNIYITAVNTKTYAWEAKI